MLSFFFNEMEPKMSAPLILSWSSRTNIDSSVAVTKIHGSMDIPLQGPLRRWVINLPWALLDKGASDV